MGSNQSSTKCNTKKVGETVVIERADIPEEYHNVRVSGEVISRINNENTDSHKKETENSSSSVLKEDNQNIKYIPVKEIRIVERGQPISENEIEAKKAVFKNAAKRVDDRFFKFQRENECAKNEDSILNCFNVNKNTPWNCSSLVKEYDECITSFLQKVSAPQ
uniref:CHCH domain-containing protein n=1 Tax=Strongyloides stercoralis TaxID=6248 RepID=A0A0K0EEF1_STRER